MTTIPDRLPEPTARPEALPRTARRDGASFERAINRFRLASTLSPMGDSVSGAQMFNEHGFFQPSVATGASKVVVGPEPGVARPQSQASEITPSKSPAERVAETAPPASTAIARAIAAPVASAESAISTPSCTPARSGQPTTIVTFARVDPETTAQTRIPLARARSADTRAATASIRLATRDTGEGLDVALHLDGPDRTRCLTLRAAILGLLSRHGFRPGHIRITGATDASPQETQ